MGRGVTFMLLEEPVLSEVRLALAGLKRTGGSRRGKAHGRSVAAHPRHRPERHGGRRDHGGNRADGGPGRDLLAIEVRDNGRGMDCATAAAATDPFFTTRTTRRVGMGLPLLAEAARAAGGVLIPRVGAGSGHPREGDIPVQPHRPRASGRHRDDVDGAAGRQSGGRCPLSARGCGRDYELSSRDLAAALEEPPGVAARVGLAAGAIRQGEAELAHEPGSERR